MSLIAAAIPNRAPGISSIFLLTTTTTTMIMCRDAAVAPHISISWTTKKLQAFFA